MEYQDYIAALRTQRPDLAEALGRFYTLENVLGWMREQGIPLSAVEIVAQDEYSHDFLVPLGDEGNFLVFGCT